MRCAQRPPLFGPEKPPHDKKKMYHYYCNKIYKADMDSKHSKPCQAHVDWFASWILVALPYLLLGGNPICQSRLCRDGTNQLWPQSPLQLDRYMTAIVFTHQRRHSHRYLGQPKTWIEEKFSRPLLAKIATSAICASASLWFGQRLLWWQRRHIVSRDQKVETQRALKHLLFAWELWDFPSFLTAMKRLSMAMNCDELDNMLW